MPRKTTYIQLFGGCYCTQLKVNPANWNKPGASLKKDWYIWYRFYDPTVKDSKGNLKPKLRLVEGMNTYTTLKERQEATRAVMEEELDLLTQDGYNPIIDKCMAPTVEEITEGTISPELPFLDALESCLKVVDVSDHTREDIRSNLKYIRPAAEQLRYQYLPIKAVRRKHVKTLLNRVGQTKDKWSNNTFNAYRKNLSILFEELIELEATEVNPVHGIKKKKYAVKKRSVLTAEECRKVDEFARNYDPRFWLLIHIFYHSGARRTEMFRVQGEHVDLKKQSVKYLVLKGNAFEWVERPIVDAALPFWEMAMEGCGKKDYVFSTGLKPGINQIRPEQITRRWRRHIKEKLGIQADWYSLKHLNTTKNVDIVFEQIRSAQREAAGITGHKSGAMIAKVYDIKSAGRMKDAIKSSARALGE